MRDLMIAATACFWYIHIFYDIRFSTIVLPGLVVHTYIDFNAFRAVILRRFGTACGS